MMQRLSMHWIPCAAEYARHSAPLSRFAHVEEFEQKTLQNPAENPRVPCRLFHIEF
jgi:hypothetical protein